MLVVGGFYGTVISRFDRLAEVHGFRNGRLQGDEGLSTRLGIRPCQSVKKGISISSDLRGRGASATFWQRLLQLPGSSPRCFGRSGNTATNRAESWLTWVRITPRLC